MFIKKTIIRIIILLLMVLNLAADPRPGILVPGVSAGVISLGGKVEQVVRLYQNSAFERVRHKQQKNLFADVFNVSAKRDILFDEIYYYNEAGLIVFCLDRTIVAIIVTYRDVVLEGAGSLARHINSVLLNFGNKGISVLKKDDNTLYLFRDRGVALFDDKSDGEIDMAAVFLP